MSRVAEVRTDAAFAPTWTVLRKWPDAGGTGAGATVPIALAELGEVGAVLGREGDRIALADFADQRQHGGHSARPREMFHDPGVDIRTDHLQVIGA